MNKPCWKFLDGACPCTEADCRFSHLLSICNPERERRRNAAKAQKPGAGASSKSSSPDATKKKGTIRVCRKATYGKCNNPNCKYSHDKAHLAKARKKNPHRKRTKFGRKGKAGGAVDDASVPEDSESQMTESDLPYIEFEAEEVSEAEKEE